MAVNDYNSYVFLYISEFSLLYYGIEHDQVYPTGTPRRFIKQVSKIIIVMLYIPATQSLLNKS